MAKIRKQNKKLCTDYKRTHLECEVWDYLSRDSVCDKLATELHHIVGGSSRYDVEYNLLHICWKAHRYIHNNPIEGKVVCWYAKQQTHRFLPVRIREFWGQCPLAYIERNLPKLNETIKGYAEELLELWNDRPRGGE